MALIEPMGRPYIACPKCKTNVVWLESLSEADRHAIAETTRQSRFEGAKRMVSEFGLDLRLAKGLSLHISQPRGKCHRCGGALSGAVSLCPNCRSANLDW